MTDDLANRCVEIIDWHKTGLLTNGAVRSLAADLRRKHPTLDEYQSLHLAETTTADQAMHFVIERYTWCARAIEMLWKNKPDGNEIEMARVAMGIALFGPGGIANPEDDEKTFCQTQKRLIEECARALCNQ